MAEEPTCDMCILRGAHGRIEEVRGNGFSEYVCDTCGWVMEFVHDEDDEHIGDASPLRVSLVDAAKFR